MRKLLLYLSAAFSFLLLSNSARAANPNLVYPSSVTVIVGIPFTITPTYTIAPNTVTTTPGLPAGWTISNTTGVITGTPTTAQIGSITYTITATKTGFGNGTETPKPTITITVINPAPNLSYNTPNVFATNSTVTLTPANSGGLPTSSTPTPSGLPTGLSISSTGVISGIPTVVTAATSYTVTSTNAAGTTTSNTFTIQIADAPAFSYLTPDGPTTNTAYTLTPTITAGSPTTWTEAGTMPAGLTLNASTGVISGTPTSTTSRTITVTATNALGLASSQTITIRPVATALFTYVNPAAYTVGVPITSLSPTTSSGFALTLATINPNLTTNTGLAISAAGVISGTPTTPSSATVYTVTAMASSGYYGTATVTVTVNAPPPPNISYTPSSYNFTAGIAGTTSAAFNSGGAATYSIDPTTPLPSYLTFNSATGVISCSTSALVTGATAYIVDATNITATVTATVSITIIAATPPVISYTPSSYTFTAGTAGATSAITNTGGAAVYSIDASTPLPAYLTFDASTGIISCSTAGVATAATNYQVDATNSTGTVNTTVSITVNPKAPAISYSPTTYSFYASVGGTTSAAANSGGTATFAVDASMPFPSYLSIDPATGVITASASSVTTAATIYKIDATNITGTASANVTITIIGPPVLSYTGHTYVQGSGNGQTISISNTGGAPTGSPLYTLTGALPTGITFNTGNGTFTVNANTVAVGTYTFTVTASNPAGSSAPSVTIIINPKAPVITYTASNTWLVGTTYTLNPGNTGGAVSTWSYTGTLPPGIGFDSSTGIISGNPTTPGSYSVTVTGTNVTGSSSKTIAFTISYPNPVISYSPANPYLSGAGISLSVTNSEAAVTTGYTYTGTLPAGVTFNASTGAISGTLPTVTGQATYSVTVTASTGSSTGNTTVSIIINPYPPAFTYNTPNVYPVSVAIPTLGPLPAGGGAVAAPGTYVATPLLTSAAGNGSLNKPYGMAVDPSGNVYVVNDNGASSTVTEYSPTGPTITVYSTGIPSGAVGIVFDSSGNAYVLGQTSKSVVKFTGGLSGSASTIITGLTTPTGIAYYAATNTLYVGDSGTNNIREYPTTGGAASFTITPPSVNFLGINITYAFISGGIAVDASGNVYAADNDYLGNLLPATGVDEYSPAGTFTKTNPIGNVFAGTAISGLYIDGSGNIYVTDTGGNTATVYSAGFASTVVTESGFNTPNGVVADHAGNFYVSDYSNNTVTKYGPTGGYYLSRQLPPGLSFSTTTGKITGTPTSPFATTSYTVTAYNAGGSGTSNTFTITCAYPPSFTYTSPPVYQVGVAITTLSPVFATPNGGGPLISATVTVNGPLPSGLTLNADGTITGTPTAANGPITYTVTGTNAAGLTGTATVTITCANGPVFSYSPLPVYPVGSAISPTLSPTVTAGGPITGATISPALPANLSIDGSGNITGIPSAASSGTYTVTATNSYGFTGTATVTINCVYAPAFTYSPTPQVDTVGVAIPMTITNVTAGSPIAGYAINTPLPGGFNFDTTTGTISGTPTATSPLTTYTVTATNSTTGLTGTAPITITVVNPRAPAISYMTPQVYTTNVGPIAPLTPTNTDGIVVSYSAPSLPAGLSIDPLTGIISGTPTTITPATDYPVTATNAGGSSTFNINITVNPPAPSITYLSPDVYNVGTAITPLTPTNTGGPILNFTVSPALPAGLSIDPLTGIITGTPTTITAVYGYVVTATNAGGSSSFTILITIVSSVPVIAYTTPDNYPVGSAIPPLVPVNTGGTPASYSISPGLPSGLNFDTTTGIITGTPTAVSAAANYLVTATNAGGTGTFTINISCYLSGPVISYTTPDIFPVGVAIAPLSPTNTGSVPTSYSISPGLPAGLNFDTTTGIISGTPTIASPATTYTVTATNGTGSGNATIIISCSGYVDWLGGTSTDWNDPTNWATNAVPTAADIAAIGVNGAFTNFPNVLAGAGTINVGAVAIGTNGSQAGGFVVNSGSTLNVTGGITYQSDANAGFAYTATISGAGSVTAGSINVNANTVLGSSYTETLASSVNSMALSSNVALTSSDASGNSYNATFNITGGTVSVAGNIQTTNTTAGTSTLAVIPSTTATLQLANAAPLSGLSATGTNLITFNNAGATIEYSGAAQTYYTDAGINGLATGLTYANIKFSGTGLKTPNGTSANNLKISGDLTNALTLNDASDYIDLSVPNVIFNGTTQNIYAGNGTGTKFYNVTFSGAGTTTIQSGKASVASSGLLVMSGAGAVLAANGLLTLNSDINGSATVGPIPAGCSITGNVNVQRFITGGNILYRGYRLVSSPVYAATVGGDNVYSLNYLINSVYLKGTKGAAGGFDDVGNPNLYLFRENLAPSNSSFTSGNFGGVNDISAAPSYSIDNDGSGFNIPVGNGYMFFFRGDRNVAPITSETSTSFVPTNTILTATGLLNQGQVTVSDWYTPGSINLGFTTTPGNEPVQGFNLVGNPYASSINWDLFNTASSTTGIYGGPGGPGVATNPFLYIIDPVSKNYNIYQSGFGGVGTIASAGSNIIPSGQGFFVVAPTATAQLVFNESAKVNTQANAANGNLFLGPPPVANVIQYMHLKLFQDSTNADGMLISFNGNAKPQYNINEDAIYKPGNGNVSLASMSADNIALAINTTPLPSLKQAVIPLTVNAIADGNFTMKLEAVKSVPVLYDFWLKDAYAKDSLDIRNNPVYAFSMMHSDTNTFGSHRFSLIIRQNPALMVHLLNFGATKVTNGDEVIWTTENEQNYTNFTVERSTDGASTFNVLGGVPSSGIGSYSLLDKTPVLGANAYRLKMTDLNGTVTYSNVVTIMYANTGSQIATNGFILYPNPTSGPMNLKMNQINAGQAYTIRIINNLGAVIKTVTSNQPNWQTDVSSLMPGTYFVEVKNNNTNALVGKSGFVKL